MSIDKKIKDLPTKPGIYIMKNKDGEVLYIGKAKNIKARVGSYFHKAADARYSVKFLMSKVSDIDYIVTANEKEAIILEDTLLKKYKPRYNIRLKDDKTYVSIKLTVQDKFPRIIITRQIKKDSSRHFGPYPSAGNVRETLRLLRKIFPLRTCSDIVMFSRKRPCIDYQIKRCLGPCAGLVTEDNYKNAVNGVIMFLEGRNTELIQSLKQRMGEASSNLDFEKAAKIRDQINAIEATLEKQIIVSHKHIDQDIFGAARKDKDLLVNIFNVRDGRMCNSMEYFFKAQELPTNEILSSFFTQYYSQDRFIPDEIIMPALCINNKSIEDWLTEKKGKGVSIIVPKKGDRLKLLNMAEDNANESINKRQKHEIRNYEVTAKELQERLRLKNVPEKIEAFDISNISGKLANGAMVVFKDGKPCKEDYRLFRIKTLNEPNDYGMMHEVLSRRYKKDASLPNLIIIDGGKGQLNICLKVLDELGIKDIDVLAIAKDKIGATGEKIYLPNVKDPAVLKHGSNIDLFLRQVRDEVHRFAIKYHKKLRKKGIGSMLEEIEGIGKKKAKNLLVHFGSIDKIKAASIEEILKVNGITRQVADKIKETLQ